MAGKREGGREAGIIRRYRVVASLKLKEGVIDVLEMTVGGGAGWRSDRLPPPPTNAGQDF